MRSLILFALFSLPFLLYAQSTRWQAKPSVGAVGMFEEFAQTRAQIKIQSEYRLYSFLEIGPYVSYDQTHWSSQIGYGLGANLQLIPLIIKKESRFQVYSRFELGGTRFKYRPNFHLDNSHDFTYSWGGGIGYLIAKPVGIFFEYNSLKWTSDYRTKTYRGGLIMRF